MSRPYATAMGVIDSAFNLFTGDRAATYGDPLPDFTRIGQVWGALLDIDPVPAHTVAAMLAGLKLVRSQISPAHQDNWVDLVAYGALGADVEERSRAGDGGEDFTGPTHTAQMKTSRRVRP